MIDGAPTIAVLDDEAAMRKALGRLLTIHGYRAVPFENVDSFLSALADESFACVLLDLHLSGDDGFAVLHAMKSRGSRPPVIVLTGHDRPGYSKRATTLGASAYLTKPVDEAVLLESIARHAPRSTDRDGGSC